MQKKRWFKWTMLIFALVVLYQLARPFFIQKEWQARNYVYDRVKSVFWEANEQASQLYGLRPYEKGSHLMGKGPIVILVHGLDEPGRIWSNLAPVLDEKGYGVLFMSYPNDQNVAASARFFFDCLKKYPFKDQKMIHVIAHSMGGLVSREMLTHPEIDYFFESEKGRLPRVKNLILVGTPNHGSELARFRFFMEIRDQVQNLFEKDGHWLQGLLDGTGAAGIDLIPGSDFLTILNSRPHPLNSDLHIIAGVISPWSDHDIHAFMGHLKVNGPDKGQARITGFEKALVKINHTIGDGLVTLDSARLDSIPLTQVQGNHLTMLKNILPDSDKMPPAIPVILEILDPKL
ncbi:MAG: acetyltransferase [Desulfobacter sp.]|nr:acetyltransferase [Desulfobacter sp.]WDP86194.1 MAG: acetyltransferase [Desulfobacter sp.]